MRDVARQTPILRSLLSAVTRRLGRQRQGRAFHDRAEERAFRAGVEQLRGEVESQLPVL